MKSIRFLVRLAVILCSAAAVALAEGPGQPVETTTLQNVFRVDAKLYSGNAPEDEAGFRELVKLGVKTIISVDGSQPNVELAHQFGLRYVHLPIGYDGVPQARGAELTKAAQAALAEGPVYIHCHHGKHRGPAATAVVCRALDGWDADQANDFLKQAGTAPDYPGLYRDVRAFHVPTAEELARLPDKFPEHAKTEPIVDTMVAIDEHFDALKAAQKAGWREIPGHPDMKPDEASTLIWEQMRELLRSPETKKRGADFEQQLTTAEQNTDALRQILHDPAGTATARDAAFQLAGKSCATCHKEHRN